MTGNSLINLNLDALSKPATVLIEKISDAIGIVFEPHRIKRAAKAEAEADKIKAVSKIEINELEQRALQRFIKEEANKQDNIEKITLQSIPLLGEDAKPEMIEKDWIVNFFDKSRLVSDDEMQMIWSNILAGEANNPGQFSKRTVNLMASLDKSDALLFSQLCNFNWLVGNELGPLIFDLDAEIYNKHGINFDALKHLDSIGLISLAAVTGYMKKNFPEATSVEYGKTSWTLELPLEQNNNIKIGQVLLTSVGRELASICDFIAIKGFDKYVLEKWIKDGIKIPAFKDTEVAASAN